MATTKPNKPASTLPKSWGGTKTPYTDSQVAGGYSGSVPTIIDGGNINYEKNAVFEQMDYAKKTADVINDIPVNHILSVNENNKFQYVGMGKGISLAESIMQLAVAAGLKFDDHDKLTLNIGNGLKTTDGKLEINIGPALTLNEENHTVGIKYHDSLTLRDNSLGSSYLISLSKSEDMTDNVIRPQITRTILRKSITEDTVFAFDNSAISDIPENTHVTLELHLNMKKVSAISFEPAVEWDNGEVPTLSAAGKDYWLVLRTEDKGTHWKGCLGSTFDGY